jgi:Fe2+ transport system protein B
MEGVKSNQAVIEVTNTAGVTVYNNQIDVRGDRVDHQIDLTDQPEGIYLVKTTVNNETVTRKVIVR